MPYLRLAIVLLALAGAFVPLAPDVVETHYSRGFYPKLQAAVTGVSNMVPVALLDIGAVALLLVIAVAFVRAWRRGGVLRAIGRTMVTACVIAAALYLWFLLFWGLNYRRAPLERKLAYDPARVTRAEGMAFGRTAVERVNALQPIGAAAAGVDALTLERALATVQQRLGIPAAMRSALPKRSMLEWYFRKASIDGMTDPFFLEILVNPDLLPFERPFVLAHEWAHLAGYADEDEANFVAWLACINGDAAAQYSGWLSAYEHVAGALPGPERAILQKTLSPGVLADLAAARTRLAAASPVVTAAARQTYDTYLRANRVEEGIRSYNAVVRLMLGTTFEPGWVPALRAE